LVLLILDFGLRRHLRASVRYALWLVFLVKLVTPPSLALPTSLAWWWSSATHLPMPAPQFQFSTFTVSQADALAPEFIAPLLTEVTLPPPALTAAAVCLLLAGGVSMGLFGWLLWRWRQVVRTGRAASDDPAFSPLQEEAHRLGNIRSPVRLKITSDTMSPAVCGLFRPVILLPQTLVDKLSAEQLRAVVLHELMHLRRGDVWVNFAQALLQIIYWWHPLVWLANARIRRVREEAVDDAVMVALREDAEIYAPTLLAVAKFAFRRPLASLGLVGILESRSALRQRIERLVNLPVPRKAGLTLVSVCGILGFASVALPMGDAPEPDAAPAGQAIATNISTNVPPAPIQSAYVPPVANPYAQTGVVNTGPGRHDIVAKLDHIHLARVDFDGVPLSEVIRKLSEQARLLDPQKTGINFMINPNPDLSGSLPPADGIIQIDPATGQPVASAASAVQPLDPDSVKIRLSLADVRLVDVLDAIVLVADQPIKYSIQDFGVVFSPKPAGAEALFTRTFKVDANTFNQGLESVGSVSIGAGGVSSVSGGGGAGNNGGAVAPRVYFVPGKRSRGSASGWRRRPERRCERSHSQTQG
jgi:beta-lactamase regulating signal transducer with metallopeptidase domain